ncbi:MAG: hypothetical protein ACKVP0_10495 [Pirellulaceae bacterium]
MSRSGMVILGVCGAFIGWMLLFLLLLLYGNEWWLSGVVTLTVFAWLAGLLIVLFQQGRLRVAATGAVISSAVYWMLTLGPWFSTNVGPALLTSRLLAHAEPLLRGNAPQTQVVTWATPMAPPIYSTGSGGPYSGSGVVTGQIVYSAPPPTTFFAAPIPPSASVFQQLGHWLFIWLVAGIGACAALLMQLRARQRKGPPPKEGHVPAPGAAS